jgi:hypothetical protein
LVEAVWIGIGWIPGAVEPVEIGLVVGIHSLIACHGGSMGSMVSMSKGGGMSRIWGSFVVSPFPAGAAGGAGLERVVGRVLPRERFE